MPFCLIPNSWEYSLPALSIPPSRPWAGKKQKGHSIARGGNSNCGHLGCGSQCSSYRLFYVKHILKKQRTQQRTFRGDVRIARNGPGGQNSKERPREAAWGCQRESCPHPEHLCFWKLLWAEMAAESTTNSRAGWGDIVIKGLLASAISRENCLDINVKNWVHWSFRSLLPKDMEQSSLPVSLVRLVPRTSEWGFLRPTIWKNRRVLCQRRSKMDCEPARKIQGYMFVAYKGIILPIGLTQINKVLLQWQFSLLNIYDLYIYLIHIYTSMEFGIFLVPDNDQKDLSHIENKILFF